MRIAIVAIVVLGVGCKDGKTEKEAEAPKPVPGAPVEPPPAADSRPAACTRYIAAMDKLVACAQVEAATKATFVRIYDGDQEVLTGKRAAPRSALETLCGARAQNVESVLASQCGPPLAERSIADLRTELDKTTFAIAVGTAVVNDAAQPEDLRARTRADVAKLEKEKATIEALIADKTASEKPVKPANVKGISDDCLNNPLAKGCS
jgi:hypothetical protein